MYEYLTNTVLSTVSNEWFLNRTQNKHLVQVCMTDENLPILGKPK